MNCSEIKQKRRWNAHKTRTDWRKMKWKWKWKSKTRKTTERRCLKDLCVYVEYILKMNLRRFLSSLTIMCSLNNSQNVNAGARSIAQKSERKCGKTNTLWLQCTKKIEWNCDYRYFNLKIICTKTEKRAVKHHQRRKWVQINCRHTHTCILDI